MSKTTYPGYINKNNQKNLERTNEKGTDHLQWFYTMECQNCKTQLKGQWVGYLATKVPNLPRGKTVIR